MSKSTVTAPNKDIPGEKYRDLVLAYSHEKDNNKITILVEGDDDVKFYDYYIDNTYAKIEKLDTCAYMPTIISMVENDSRIKDKVIAIKDSDFDKVLVRNEKFENLFLTDTHDHETLCVNPELEEKLRIETGMKNSDESLLYKVMSDLYDFSMIRLYNHIKVDEGKDGINFEGLDLEKIYKGIEPIDLDNALLVLGNWRGNSNLDHFPKKTDIEYQKQKFGLLDLRILTRGHDLLKGINRRLHALRKTPELGEKELGRLFRAHFSLEMFKETELCRSIAAWASVRCVQILK